MPSCAFPLWLIKLCCPVLAVRSRLSFQRCSCCSRHLHMYIFLMSFGYSFGGIESFFNRSLTSPSWHRPWVAVTQMQRFSLAPRLLLVMLKYLAIVHLPPVSALHQLLNEYSDPLCLADTDSILCRYSIKLLVKLNPGRICLGVRTVFSITNHVSLMYRSHCISHLSQ